MTGKSDLVSNVENRVDAIPSALTSSVIQEYIEDSHLDIERDTGDSFSTSDIPTKYQSILVDMAVIKVLDYMVTHNVSAGGALNISAADMNKKIDRIRVKVDKAMQTLIRTKGSIKTSEPEETEDY